MVTTTLPAATQYSFRNNAPAAASKEDTPSSFQVQVSGVGPPKIIPLPNVLDKFSSYTYQASVYLLTPAQYVNFTTGNRIIPSSQLLFQSGGKAAGTGNKFFDNDFYIDNITIETRMPGKLTRGAHMATDIKFTVTEPMGITLLDRLKNAVAAQRPNSKGSWAAAHYLMTISFFGYDEKGNLVTPGTPVTAGATQNPKAVLVKYIPFVIKDVTWSVGSKLVSYEFSGAPIGQVTGGSSGRGTGESDFEITAATVGEFFGAYSTTSAALANLNELPPTSNTGLVGALNKQAERAAKQSGFKQPDRYNIIIIDAAAINSADLGALEPFKNKKRTEMAAPANQSPSNLDSAKISASTTRQSIPITAGTPITNILDLVIRDSRYITSKQIANNDSDGGLVANSNNTDPPTWYLITYSAKPLEYDDQRKDYAYDMLYTITRYAIPNLHSDRFPFLKTFPGLHKEYKYWFTGENTSILDYSARYDSMYKLTTNGYDGESASDRLRQQQSASKNDLYRDDLYAMKRGYAPRSTEPTGLSANNTNEGSANAAEYLYSPDTLATSKIKILGDPAWIQQGSLVSPIGYNDFATETQQGFLPDGTISFDTAQALYEIAWQRPEDYNISSGLADPYAKTFQKYGEREPLQSYIYQAIKVTNEFRSGRFEQTIDGVICLFNKPKETTTAEQFAAADRTRPAIGESPTSRTQAQSVTQSNTFGNLTNPSLVPAATISTGTTPAPVLEQAAQNSISTVPATTAEQFAAVDNARSPITQVPNIVSALPPGPVTSNGQTVGGYGFGTVLNTPPVLTPGAGRTSIDALQASAVNIPPYLTTRDP